MKKGLIYFLLIFSGLLNAQDIIYKKDNTKIEAKITEITPSEIKYKLFNYEEGPTIIIPKSDVTLIVYQNGVHEVINSEPSNQQSNNTPQKVVIQTEYRPLYLNLDSIEKVKINKLLSTNNYFSINILEAINGSFNITYVREFLKNYIHVYVPLSIGFTTPRMTQSVNSMFTGNFFSDNPTNFSVSSFSYTTKTYEIGLGIHIQTSPKRRVTHFIGPYISQSQFDGTYTKSEWGKLNNNQAVIYTDHTFILDRIFFMLDNGVLFRASKNFNIMMLAGFGYHTDSFRGKDLTKADNYRTQSQRFIPLNAMKFGVNFGYRF